MAFDNNQKEASLPLGSNNKRTSLDFLPKYYRTPANQKFLSATLDQLISEGTVEKVNAFIGRKTTPAYKTSDRYLEEISTNREAYQFEPAVVSKDMLGNVTFFKDYNDYINQLKFFTNGDINHSNVNSEEYYAWNPHIDWDKFVNYREYYWLPAGPQAVTVLGQTVDIVSTYTVKLSDQVDNISYVFSPDGLTQNPTFKLYRGQTYNFDIDCDTRPFVFKTVRTLGNDNIFTEGVTVKDVNGTLVASDKHIAKGVITFTVPLNAPNLLYYVSETDIDTSGYFTIYDIDESTEINVDQEIIGKKSYITSAGIPLSNGMKITFDGMISPEKYASGNWYVEGVGTSIVLVSDKDLYSPSVYTNLVEIEFDTENFDTQGFDINDNFPGTKDYIVINRSSKDQNPWTRHNRWVHRNVIEASAIANNQPAIIDQNARAKRPIIEFDANVQLWNFGRVAKNSVTVVDTFTTDVFSTIEGSFGYNIDGVDLVEGMRVLFTADTDTLVSGRIFKIAFISHLGNRQITLLPDVDSDPLEGEAVLVVDGLVNRGKMFHYTDAGWIESQAKTSVNQSPLFEVVDPTGTSYGDITKYPGTTFAGSKLFSYEVGTTYDAELGFNITYQNVGNFGDIVFNFNLHSDKFSYQNTTNSLIDIRTELGYLRLNTGLTTYAHANGWITAESDSFQYVVQQYDIDQLRNMFPIDAYENSAELSDLVVNVYVNGKRKYNTDYTIVNFNRQSYIQFFTDLSLNDVLLVKTKSSAPMINGYYEFPFNLENNPQNLNLNTFTLGEINNHVNSIADNIPKFVGVVPGVNSLRDYGNISSLGKKIVQHSAPILPIAYHITNKNYNIINALRESRVDYAKFKRNLLRKATEYGYDGITRIHLDLILKEITKDFTKNDPYFLSDMIPFGANFVFEQSVLDDSIVEYPLIFNFNLLQSSEKAVLVYINDFLLNHGSDYIFTDNNFVKILAPIEVDDNLKIIQYDKTDGCFLPPTPSKLGLYPKFEPKIYIDNTYQTPTKVIQGHDGSITVAFDDFRDDLLLEFERRIFNNIKSNYNTDLFDLYDFIPGYTRDTGLTSENINSIMVGDFLRWSTLISEDYANHSFFNATNPLTYNYNRFTTPDGDLLPGFWRNIFKHVYDTDRPNTHPWEMLGFSIKPLWWDSVYGPAPYTSNNLILWKDLSEGLIREPGKLVIKNNKFVRPNLLNMIPVNENGNIISPLDINIVAGFSSSLVEGKFVFGDGAPIESAWRKSSEYPFSLITALTILRPAKVFSTCFDRERQYRDDTGQIVYKTVAGNLRFNIPNLIVPSTPDDNSRVFSAGLVNFIVDYIIKKQSITEVHVYEDEIANLQVRMSSKIGGFTTKEKFKLILDSRSPLNTGNVFVPEENYDIILNTSSPVTTADYSAVIIEKQVSGFVIRGYSKASPMFNYYSPLVTNNDSSINVGGVSESFSTWNSNSYYVKDTIVSYDGAYYRTTVAHQAGGMFEIKYFVKLPNLPISGGRDIVIRSKFDTTMSVLHYGAELKTIQDVVDFLIGYEAYLKSIGFKFDNFNSAIRNIADFTTSAKEFAFWTTQRWAAGAVISVSPLADGIKFSQQYAVVDNIYDSFYDYSILKQDGIALSSVNTGNTREGNLYTLTPKETADGIYHASLSLVQKEHVLILDNITIFNDIIYDQIQGYRQERIKVVGYRTSDWEGDFDIPGFIYDRATVSFWTPWTDFSLGDTVKYKEFYYTANTNVTGNETFNYAEWNKLSAKPTPKLIPNWDYRANQFADFYDLDTDSFDLEQQKFAQHLIGYQKRQYLENIINDDVSQYKFYQGFISEKGTSNSLNKLFDPLSSSLNNSLEFYEEWAIRVGQYGSSAGFDEVEYRLDEAKFLINPQPVELVNSINSNLNDFVYRILPGEVYLKSNNYNHRPFPTKKIEQNYVSTAGYVCPEDVEIRLETKDLIPTVKINDLNDGYYFWIAIDKNTWNVYRLTEFENLVRSITIVSDRLRITLNRLLDTDIRIGDYIGFNNTNADLEGFRAVVDIGIDYFEIAKPTTINNSTSINLTLNLFKLISVRLPSIDGINSLGIPNKKPGDIVWIDGTDNNWSVWKYNRNYALTTFTSETPYSGKVLVVDKNDTTLTASTQNSVLYYTRPSNKADWTFKSEITPVSTQSALVPNLNLLLTANTFGSSVAMSNDGQYLAVGVPGGSVTSSSTNTNQGYVVLYVKNINGYFDYVNTVISTVKVNNLARNNEFFGHAVGIIGDKLIVASKGSSTVMPTITGFYISQLVESSLDVSKTSYDAAIFYKGVAPVDLSVTLGTTIVGMSVADNGNIAVSFSNNAVKIWNYSFSTSGFRQLVQNIVYSTPRNFDPIPWTTVYSYVVNDVVTYNNKTYICTNSHISSKTFDQDYNTISTLWRALALADVWIKGSTLQIYNGASWAVAGKEYASSITLSKDGQKFAIGIPTYSNTHPNEGAVVVYTNAPSTYSTWSVAIPGLVPTSSSTTSLDISLGIKTLTIRRSGSGLKLNISTTFGIIQPSPITISAPGSKYLEGDIVKIVGGNNNATFKITEVNQVTGAVVAGTLLARGTGYSVSSTAETIPNGLTILESQQVTITYDESNKMIGLVESYDDTTATLVVNIKEIYTPGLYEATEFLLNPVNRGDEKFGSSIMFNTLADQIAIGSIGGRQTDYTTFDTALTTFDLDATTFLEAEYGVGSVSLYDLYDTKFIFADTLDVGDATGTNYGSSLAVGTKFYIGDFTTTSGAFHEFSSVNKSWYKFREPTVAVNIDKIKSVFLYDIEENQIISYLDVVDPLQGKILGIAEEELSFKTYYDPAVYTIGTDDVVVDPLMGWKNQNIGLLWWDLSSAKFIDPHQGSILYKANTWNNIFDDGLVEVYEWVSSQYSPSEWDALADSEIGLTQGISGQSKHGNKCYSTSKVYDTVSKTFTTTYYFWVKNTVIVPDVSGRTLSAKDVADYISSPKNKGISYIAFHGANEFSLANCKNLISGKKVAVNIRYWVIDNFAEANIHSHYQLLSNSDISRPINKYIEQKWIDSLSGFDSLGNPVPDLKVPVKLRYGIQSRPRQSMFVNRVEALKQFIERVNGVLSKKSIIDDFDFTSLNSKDQPPSLGSGMYDYEISSFSQIRFVGTNQILTAKLTPVIQDGKMVRIDIIDPGLGYVNPPNVVINGLGSGAKIVTALNTNGQVVSATVEKQGTGYTSAATLTVRPLTVLVTSDESSSNRWALYTWNSVKKDWYKEKTQTYDTTRYWKYKDWYLTGYNEFTRIDHALDFIYQLPSANVNIGDIVKVKNQGIGGWVLLEKIDNQDVLETTVNYKTIGRESGTIEFTDNLYRFASNAQGFDGPTFDSYVFDDQPKVELQIILSCIKNNIFIDDLAVEYKELFFASLRYAFSEQKFIDWAFKTSFVRSKHNLGYLEQKPTYQNDNLASYQEYINEVKPYRSKIREFVSTYEVLEFTNSNATDFDLPPRYIKEENVVKTFETKISGGVVTYDSTDIEKYPYTDWLYNTGFNLTSIEIFDSGSGYFSAPDVIIEGAPTTISAKAYLSAGRVTKIVIDDPFNENFLYTPTIIIDGSFSDTGSPAKAVAILSNSLVRSTKVGIKFDRISATHTVTDIKATERFIGSGSRTRFELAWPIDIIKTRTSVSDNTGEVLGADYEVFNEIDTSVSYKRYKGILQFNTAPANLSNVVIEYYKDIQLFDAADRINHFYPDSPAPGQLGKNLGQLMQGVDYGGVEITGIGFEIGSGWDALPWFTTGYDTSDPDFTDKLIRSDGSTREFRLDYIPTEIEYINIYWVGSRSTQAADVPGTGTAGSTSLVVSNIAGIEKGQTVEGVGIPTGTLVSSISGATVTLTKTLSVTASGSYRFTINESFNRRLDDPNYLQNTPLLARLTSLTDQRIALESGLATAQADKDRYEYLQISATQLADVLFEQYTAAVANGAPPLTISQLDADYRAALAAGLTALDSKNAAIAILLSANKNIAGYTGIKTLTPVTITGLTGELSVPLVSTMTYYVGQSITITGPLGSGIIPGYVSGTTYYVSAVITNPSDVANNYTRLRITKTYSNAIQQTPVLDILTVPDEIQAPSTASFVLNGLSNTLQSIVDQLPSILNADAVMNSFIGNGSDNGPIVIPDSVSIADGDNIILRKNSSDGSFKPSDIAYDTQLFGGDFSYRSATGIAPEDINVDGDGFVTPMTSHAPEEVVTGQVVDTVDITVYDKISDGAPIIETTLHLIANGVTGYSIGQRPGTSSAVIVKANDKIIKQNIDYTVNFNLEQVILTNAYITGPDYVEGSELVINSLSQNGLDILDLDYFTGDGETTEFISVARWNSDVTVFVTVNGEAADVTIFKTTASYDLVGNTGIRFDVAPAVNSVINYTVLASSVDSISKVQKQNILHTGQRNDYVLTRSPEFAKPYTDNVLVVYDGLVLQPPDTVYFIVAGNNRTYYVDSSKYAYNSVDSKAVTVTVNGVSIVQSVDYFWFPINNQLKLKKGIANVGDKVALTISAAADYLIADTPTGTVIEFSNSYPADSIITVITFSNHDILEIERSNTIIKSASILTPGYQEYYNFNQIAGGRIKLRRPAIASQYVWISLNKQLLTPDVDYALESNMNYIAFSSSITFLETDTIDVIAFSNKITKNSFGYKIFKDMLNKNLYTRIDDASSTTLTNTLHFYDSTITVEDSTMLATPNARANKPGVLFINGERIEYLRKDGNVLRQLKRGTLGTGVKSIHDAGDLVRDQSVTQTVPYKDEYITSVTVSDGYNLGASIYSNSSSVTITSVIFAGEDQTASPFGNDLVTVNGTGFKINVRLFVGDVECTVNRVSETKLTFLTPAKIVGAYDLIIYNPPITAPSTVTTPSVSGLINASTATTTITMDSSILGILRVGMTLTAVGTGVGNFGTNVKITQINSPTLITIRAESINTYGTLVFTGTENVRITSLTGTVVATDNPLVSTVTLSGTYIDILSGLASPFVTNGFKVGMILSKIDGLGGFGSGAIITGITTPAAGNNPLSFTITSTSPNTAGAIVFNINNQTPTSYVSTAAVKYLKVPLNFTPLASENSTWYRKTDTFAVTNIKFIIGKTYTINSVGTTNFTSIGASRNEVGLKFIATSVGTGTGTVTEYLNIPSNFNQCDDLEVFVAGRRLRKSPYTLWNPNATATQVRDTDGDIQYEAEFSVNGDQYIRLTDVLDAGQYVVIQKRIGRTWVTSGVGLADSNSEQATFIKSSYALLPDKNKV